MKLIDDRLSWYVVRTNIKCEKKAAENLRLAGYSTYVPMMRKDIVHHRTKAVIVREFVLFNRYIFVGIGNGDFFTARQCDGVECFLGVEGRPMPIPGSQVAEFQAAEQDMAFDDTRAAKKHRGDTLERAFPTGIKIVVKDGHAFGGFYGQVSKTLGKSKVRALLEMFGGLVPVEFDASEVRAA